MRYTLEDENLNEKEAALTVFLLVCKYLKHLINKTTML